MARIELLAVGNEILNGDVRDSDMHLLAREIADLGGHVERMGVVPDEIEVIAAAVREGLARGTTLLITIGGLGPTPDDVTLAGVARATGRALRLDRAALAFVARRYAELARSGVVRDAALSPPREKMARLPEGARWLPNAVGTAPAPVLVLPDGATIVSLPAPPPEFEAIVRGPLRPLLREALGGAAVARASYLLDLEDETRFAAIHDRVQPRHPDVYLKSRFHAFAHGHKLAVTLAARGGHEEEARRRLAAACADLEAALAKARIIFSRKTASLTAQSPGRA